MPRNRSLLALRGATLAAVVLVVVFVAFPRAAQAQMCIGSPNDPGQFSMGLYLDFMDEGTGYGLVSMANLDSPFALGATLGTVDFDDLDGNQTLASVTGLMEFPFPRFTACPVVELQWGTSSESFQGGTIDIDQWIFPLGVSMGARYQLNPTIDLLPSARAGLMHMRTSFSGDGFGSESENATEFFLDTGLTFSFTPFHVRGSLRWVSGDDPDLMFDTASGTAFGISAGLRF